MTTGLDYSAGALTSRQIKAAGHLFVIRYVDHPTIRSRKLVTRDEYAELTTGGVTVWLVFEVSTTDMLGGAAAGAVNAARALAGAKSVGHTGIVFMACDMHLTAAQIPTALGYIRAAETVLGHGRTGVYGFPELITAAKAAGLGVAYWQCGHDPGPKGSAHIWQRNDTSTTVGGIACDVNVIYQPPPGVTVAAATTPAVRAHHERDQMYIKCETTPGGKVLTGILSGSLLIGLGEGGETASADLAISNGATVQWVVKGTWDALDASSHHVHDNPRPVTVVAPTVKA